ncbi:MAG: hypothetical protein ABUS79_13900 [Pseudomonadota bacterium]
MTTKNQPLILAAMPDAPLACDLSDATDTPEERLAEYGRLFAHALIGRGRTPDGATFTFAAKAGVFEWVADLARREAACCPFLGHEVRRDGAHVTWRFSTQRGATADAVLDEVHDLPDRFAIQGGDPSRE